MGFPDACGTGGTGERALHTGDWHLSFLYGMNRIVRTVNNVIMIDVADINGLAGITITSPFLIYTSIFSFGLDFLR